MTYKIKLERKKYNTNMYTIKATDTRKIHSSPSEKLTKDTPSSIQEISLKLKKNKIRAK